jgi:hypothetical protein
MKTCYYCGSDVERARPLTESEQVNGEEGHSCLKCDEKWLDDVQKHYPDQTMGNALLDHAAYVTAFWTHPSNISEFWRKPKLEVIKGEGKGGPPSTGLHLVRGWKSVSSVAHRS